VNLFPHLAPLSTILVVSSDTGDGYNITAVAYCAHPNDVIAGLYTANVSSFNILLFTTFFIDILQCTMIATYMYLFIVQLIILIYVSLILNSFLVRF